MRRKAGLILTVFLLLSLLTAISVQPAKGTGNSGPIAWWKLNEGSGTKALDSSGNGYDGKIIGCTWVNSSGNSYLSFNGQSDRVDLPSFDLTGLNSLTVAAWINSDLTQVGFIAFHGNLGTFEMGNGDLSYEAINFNKNSTYAGFHVKLSDGSWHWLYSPSPMQPNIWHQIVGVWVKGSALMIYVNGALVGQTSNIGNLSLFDSGPGFPNSLGVYSQNHWGQFDIFKGQMSNVMVYNRALSTQEIENLYIQFSEPLSTFEWTPEIGTVGNPLTFNASMSQPNIGGTQAASITSYNWDFGDGTALSTDQVIVTHTYTAQNLYNVTLTIFENSGKNASSSQIVKVKMPTTLTVSTASSALVGSAINIEGNLTDIHGNRISNQTIVVSYTFSGANSWILISSSITDTNGFYSIQWLNTASGTFLIKAEWQGNDTFVGVNNTVSLSSLPLQSQHAFLVESNSTISSLEFNSASFQLGFSANGPSGTNGYTKVTIAKTLITSMNEVTVYLDGKQVPYDVSSTSETWLISLSYSHSTHAIIMNLPLSNVKPSLTPQAEQPTAEPSPTPTANYSEWVPYTIVALVVLIGLSVLVYFMKRKRR